MSEVRTEQDMTREQAEEMVDDLIQAHHDYETVGRKSYRQDYLDHKERVIAALMRGTE